MYVALGERHGNGLHAQGVFHALGVATGKERRSLVIGKDGGSHVQEELVHEAGFKQGKRRAAAALAKHIEAVLFGTEYLQHLPDIEQVLEADSDVGPIV